MDLFKYQDEGASALAAAKAKYLADDPGLGKSAQLVTATDRVGAERALYCVPASLKVNWAREYDKWSLEGLPVYIPTPQDPLPRDKGVTIINYEMMTMPAIHRQLRDIDYDVIGFDEGHYLKTPESQRTRAALGEYGIAKGRDHVWLASGTMIPNHIGEIYPVLASLYPQAVSGMNYDQFLKYYCVTRPTQYSYTVVANKPTISRLKELTREFILRRRRMEVLPDLPDLVVGSMTVENTHAAKAIKEYMDHAPEALAYLGDEEAPEDLLETIDEEAMATLRKICGIAKTHAIGDVVEEELNNGMEQIVLMCWHHEVIDMLTERLEKFGVAVVDGRVPVNKRQDIVDRFNAHGYTAKCRVFIGQVLAAGVGHTMTGAHDMIIVEPSWVPGENVQAMLRIHRIGQLNKCLVRFAKLAGSIDEAIVSSQERKARLIAEFM